MEAVLGFFLSLGTTDHLWPTLTSPSFPCHRVISVDDPIQHPFVRLMTCYLADRHALRDGLVAGVHSALGRGPAHCCLTAPAVHRGDREPDRGKITYSQPYDGVSTGPTGSCLNRSDTRTTDVKNELLERQEV